MHENLLNDLCISDFLHLYFHIHVLSCLVLTLEPKIYRVTRGREGNIPCTASEPHLTFCGSVRPHRASKPPPYSLL